MLVIACKLREHGKKLKGRKRSEKIRGHLVLQLGHEGSTVGGPTRQTVTAYLHNQLPPAYPGQSYFPMLLYARVIRLNERGLVVVGMEMVAENGGTYEQFPQAWACVPVREPFVSPTALTPSPLDPPSDG